LYWRGTASLLAVASLLVYKEARSVAFVVAFVVVSSHVRVVAAAAEVGKGVAGVADVVVVVGGAVGVVAIEKVTRSRSGPEETGLQQAAPWGSQACQLVEVVVAAPVVAVAAAVVAAVVEAVIGTKRSRNGRETVTAAAAVAVAVAVAVAAEVLEAEHKDQLLPNG
jgi:hypothetical protein